MRSSVLWDLTVHVIYGINSVVHGGMGSEVQAVYDIGSIWLRVVNFVAISM